MGETGETETGGVDWPNPLWALHERAGAEFQAYDRLQIVSTFGEPEAEYAAIRKGAAIVDQPQRGFLELSGADRMAFLNNLLTNQTWDKNAKAGLPAGRGVYAFFLNTKGRIVADMNVLELGDRTLIETDVRLVETLRTTFERYLFAEKVTMRSRVGELHQAAIHGPRAREVLNEVASPAVGELEGLGSAPTRILGHDVVVWRDDPCAVSGYHLVMPTGAAEAVWSDLVTRFGPDPAALQSSKRVLRPTGWAAFNACRIEGGRPMFAIDFDDSVLPAETGQMGRAVSLTKGCYLGQEIVARMHARGQVARQLVGLRVESGHLPIAGSPVFDSAGNAVGGITSSTVSPVLSNVAVCLGYVKKGFFAPGTKVTVAAEGAMREGEVVGLPFVGSGG